MPSDEPLRLYNWRPKSLAKLKSIICLEEDVETDAHTDIPSMIGRIFQKERFVPISMTGKDFNVVKLPKQHHFCPDLSVQLQFLTCAETSKVNG